MGFLNARTPQQVLHQLDIHPEVDTLVLTASGGSLDDAATQFLGREIRKRGLNTALRHDSVIASGAVDLFLSGKSRSIEYGALLGVHGWRDRDREASDFIPSSPEHRKYIQYTEAMLGSAQFYWFTIRAASADDIHWMTHSEIVSYDIVPALNKATKRRNPFGKAFKEARAEILSD